MVTVSLGLPPFYDRSPQGATGFPRRGVQVKWIAAGWKTLPARQKTCGGDVLKKAFSKTFSLSLGTAELRVDDRETVLPRCFFQMNPWKSPGSPLKSLRRERKQARSRMGLAACGCHRKGKAKVIRSCLFVNTFSCTGISAR
jgi:hypothetical protein